MTENHNFNSLYSLLLFIIFNIARKFILGSKVYFLCTMFALILPCVHWFLQDRRYITKKEKPLRATICFSNEHTCPCDGSVKMSNDVTFSRNRKKQYIILDPMTRWQQGLQKTIGLISKTTISNVHHTCLYISLPFLHVTL